MKNVFVILVLFLCLSCQKDRTLDLLIGIWESTTTVEENGIWIQVYTRKDDLKNKKCLIFAEGNIYKTWDSDFCGSPPSPFFLTAGKYNRDQNQISLKLQNFESRKVEIIELTATKLKLKDIQ